MAVGSSNDFDLIVLGAGTGGYTAAFRGAQLGLRVALVDEDKLGGTCLHRGCIPTKAMLESAALNERLRHAADYGLKLQGDAELDFPQIAKRRDQIVTRMWKGVTSLVKKNDVTWIAGRGRLEGAAQGPGQLAGEDGTPGAGGERVLNGTDVILATGSRVKSPAGHRARRQADRHLGRRPASRTRCRRASSSSAPGAVGVEFASMYKDLGAEVTLLEYLPAIVPLEDREVSKELERTFNRRGIKVITNARFDAGASRPATTASASRSGRTARTGPRDPGGDPPRRRRPRHERRGRRARHHVGRGRPRHRQGRRPHADPRAPPVRDRRHRRRADARPHRRPRGDHRRPHDRRRPGRARDGLHAAAPGDLLPARRSPSIGLTEQECEAQGLPIKTSKVPFQAIAKALIGGEYEGFAKVIAHAETQDTLGIHLIGPHATDLIAEASLAFTLDATPWEIGLATHAHPTLSEIIGEAAMAIDGRSINW